MWKKKKRKKKNYTKTQLISDSLPSTMKFYSILADSFLRVKKDFLIIIPTYHKSNIYRNP